MLTPCPFLYPDLCSVWLWSETPPQRRDHPALAPHGCGLRCPPQCWDHPAPAPHDCGLRPPTHTHTHWDHTAPVSQALKPGKPFYCLTLVFSGPRTSPTYKQEAAETPPPWALASEALGRKSFSPSPLPAVTGAGNSISQPRLFLIT